MYCGCGSFLLPPVTAWNPTRTTTITRKRPILWILAMAKTKKKFIILITNELYKIQSGKHLQNFNVSNKNKKKVKQTLFFFYVLLSIMFIVPCYFTSRSLSWGRNSKRNKSSVFCFRLKKNRVLFRGFSLTLLNSSCSFSQFLSTLCLATMPHWDISTDKHFLLL